MHDVALICWQSLIDDAELAEVQAAAEPIKEQVAAGEYRAAFKTFGHAYGLALQYSSYVDSYNFQVFETNDVPLKKRTLLENG